MLFHTHCFKAFISSQQGEGQHTSCSTSTGIAWILSLPESLCLRGSKWCPAYVHHLYWIMGIPSQKLARGELLLRAACHQVHAVCLWRYMGWKQKRFCCAAAILMRKWDPEMLCSTSVALREAFLQGFLVPRLIEITPKGSFKSNSLPHVCSLFFTFLRSCLHPLEQKPLKCFSGKGFNVIQRKLMWSQGWLLFSLKPLAVAVLAGVRWDLKHNWETQDELNKEQAGSWRLLLSFLCVTSWAHAEPFDPSPGHSDVAAWA